MSYTTPVAGGAPSGYPAAAPGGGAPAGGGYAYPGQGPAYPGPPPPGAFLAPSSAQRRARTDRRMTVRTVLILVVALPLIATGILTGIAAGQSWNSRQAAQVVARDAAALEQVAYARAKINDARIPAMAVSFAGAIGVSEAELSQLLNIDFATEIKQGTSLISGDPTFSSTPTLRADLQQANTLIPEVEAGTVTFDTVKTFMYKFAADIDALWYADYGKLQKDAAQWRPPGSFEAGVAVLRQTYLAFVNGGYEIEGAIYVLENQEGAAAKQELLTASGVFQSATQQIVGNLGPLGQTAWQEVQSSAATANFNNTVQQGIDYALNGAGFAPFVTNVHAAGNAMVNALQYLNLVDNLVRSASDDLRNSAMSEANAASRDFTIQVILLLALFVVSVGGVLVAGRRLTSPLKRLATAAQKVHSGDFNLETLPEDGPREVVSTTQAFNDMSSTLKGVEARTVALATEDLSHPDLQSPLPGRTGQALQAAVDRLTARIRERELQRRELHHTATHDRLTSLYNRAAVFDYLENDVNRRRQQGETVAVLFVDLDGLKPLNDTYGHEAGDAAIRATSEALLQATGPCDVVGRLGGDEFLVVLCSKDSADGHNVAQRIKETVSQRSIPIGDQMIPLRASVGVALAECGPVTDPMDLVRQADEAMYDAKKTARATRDHLAG